MKIKYQFLFFFITSVLLIISIYYAINFDFFHIEHDIYLPNYLSNKSIMKIIFNPLCELDLSLNHFRGRELGNFFNYLDSRIIIFLFRNNITVFISVINYLCIITMILMLTFFAQHVLKKNIYLSYSLIVLLLTSPPIIFSGSFYRTNKIVAATGLLCCILLSMTIYYNNKTSKYHLVLLSFASVFTSLVDEQGLAFICLLCGLLFAGLFINTKKYKSNFLVIFISLLVVLSYRSYFGPLIFQKINNVIIVLDTISFADFFNYKNFFKSFKLLYRYSYYLVGNLHGIGGIIIYTSAFIYFSNYLLRKSHKKILTQSIFLCTLLYTVLVIHLMTIKHKALFWNDIVSYYSLPIVIMIFCFVFFLSHILALEQTNLKKFFIPIIAIILLNVYSLHHYSIMIRNGHLSKGYALKSSLITKAVLSDEKTRNNIIESFPQSPFGNKKSGLESILIIKEKLNNK